VVVVEELGQPAMGNQQDLVEVEEATKALPVTQPEIPKIDEHRFQLCRV
jgi:hypothetical protein